MSFMEQLKKAAVKNNRAFWVLVGIYALGFAGFVISLYGFYFLAWMLQ